MRLLGPRNFITIIACCCNAHGQQHQRAQCLEGNWDGSVWATGGILLPGAIAAARCLAEKDVLFVGGSTTRELFDQAVLNMGLVEDDVQRQYCDLKQGFGCYDCVRGCHSSFYHGKSTGLLFERIDIDDPCILLFLQKGTLQAGRTSW